MSVFFLLAVGQAVIMLADFWLKLWAESQVTTNSNSTSSSSGGAGSGGGGSNNGGEDYVGWFVGLTVIAVVLSLARAWLFFVMSIRASSVLHDTSFGKIVRAPMSFFSANPLGRILNRFSSDQ